jgi:hypothetical protein
MHITRRLPFLTLSLVILLAASACSGISLSSEPVPDMSVDSATERLSDRADETLAELQERGSNLQVIASETVTLSQLQAAGIPVGSHEIGCDDPLDIVVVEGMFDRENLFSSGAKLAGGSFEALAMEMVAEIYDPETDMPLGMIGDETGGSLSGITQSSDGSVATGTIDGGLMLTSASSGDDEPDSLVPEAVCQ